MVEGTAVIVAAAPDAVVAEEAVASTAVVEAPPLLRPPQTRQPYRARQQLPRCRPTSAETAMAAPVPSAEASGAGNIQRSPAKPIAPSRLVAPTVVAPPELAADELKREAPREPLSQLSLALPPKPEMKNEWAGTPFFRPLAIESAVFESKGRTIAISGAESVPLDESCVYEGVSWPCGVRARTAFRLWLRSRALVCQLPDEEQPVT